jgi:MOSC domain-containing protein YiiM
MNPIATSIDFPITPARKLTGRVGAVLAAQGGNFISSPVASLTMTFGGIAGDFHEGLTRRAGGREPWHPRGTEMRNERQVSLVADEECADITAAMGLPEVKPEWMGANIVIAGIAHFSMLPPRTLLMFEGGVTLKVDGQNAPCRQAGRAIAQNAGAADVEGVALAFKDAAKRARGLVAWVEVPGRIAAGETVNVRVPEQWIYV